MIWNCFLGCILYEKNPITSAPTRAKILNYKMYNKLYFKVYITHLNIVYIECT